MKKLIFAFVLMFGAIFASCINSTKSINADSINTVQVDTLNADTALVDTVCMD